MAGTFCLTMGATSGMMSDMETGIERYWREQHEAEVVTMTRGELERHDTELVQKYTYQLQMQQNLPPGVGMDSLAGLAGLFGSCLTRSSNLGDLD